MNSLAAVARMQLAIAKELGDSLKTRMEIRKKTAPDWTPDEDWRRDFQSVTTTLQHAGQSLMRALEGQKKNLGTLTEEQLEAQFRSELIKAAHTISDEDWQRMCEARANRGQQ